MMDFKQEEKLSQLKKRIPILKICIALIIFLIVYRLYHLQIVHGEKYSKLATEIVVREERLFAKRGKITDRHGKVIASNRSYFEVTITPQYLKNKDEVLDTLTKILPITKKEILERLNKARYEPKFLPVPILEDLSYDDVAKLNEILSPIYDKKNPYQLESVALRAYPIREYLYPELFSHTLGYINEISRERLKRYQKKYPGIYSLGDLIGLAGVEYHYDKYLKGVDGKAARIVDARGREMTAFDDLKIIKNKASIKPKSGLNLKTTLDFDAQLAAKKALGKRKGAVVALDPFTGEVLTLYSNPSYDANRIIKNKDRKYWVHVNVHEDKILFNRAVQAMYPPASTFKTLMLAAAVEEKVINPKRTKYNCRGGLKFGRRFFKCWKHSGHGKLKAIHGLSQSCDVYFYKIGSLLGIDRIHDYAKKFGLGALTEIDIPYEKKGLVPSREWKQRVYKQKWIDSETLSVSIGQSYNLVTPLQMARMVAMVANGGYLVKPHLGKSLIDQNGDLSKKIKTEKTATSFVDSPSLEWVKKGMMEVVHGYGTAKRLRSSPYKIAGKTGTAQVISHDSRLKKTKNTEDHGLFVAFAPYDDPKIAISVIVENGRSGSGAAAPVAMEVINAYMAKNYPEYDSKNLKIGLLKK